MLDSMNTFFNSTTNFIIYLSCGSVSLVVVVLYFYFFYPQQSMPKGVLIEIKTPNFKKYRNDCLHPCIRFIPSGFLGHNWWMVQSPYYGQNSKIENPILYYSDDSINWIPVAVVRETPIKGYNSDPNLFYEDGKLWIFWRECFTPLGDSIDSLMATVGVWTLDGKAFSEPQVFLSHKEPNQDTEQSPILIKREGRYLFYAVHYQYEPERKNLGIAIWEGSSLTNPDFYLREVTKLPIIYTCDKFKQLKISKYLFFIPKPLKHDVWHFDLVEHDNKLYMLSVAEWGDNIMLSIADDYKHFKTMQKPLVNTHYSNQQYLYKPTGFIQNKVLVLYYTARNNLDKNANQLFLTTNNFL